MKVPTSGSVVDEQAAAGEAEATDPEAPAGQAATEGEEPAAMEPAAMEEAATAEATEAEGEGAEAEGAVAEVEGAEAEGAAPEETVEEEPVAETTEQEPTEQVAAEATSGGDYAALLAEAKKARGQKRIQAYEQAVAANPNGGEALTELSWLLLQRGKNGAAAEYAARAVKVNPTSAKAWVTLGAARQTLGDRSAAMKAYRSCVEQGEGARYVSQCRAMLR
jgi:tetratricopeptide (TPR) repeat protein